MDQIIKEIYEGILNGDNITVPAKVKSALESGISPAVILHEGMISAMTEVGRRFESGEFYIPEMLISARSMQVGMAHLKPYLVQAHVKSSGRVAIGTVKGDLHDIGKNLVAMMLEGAGFEIKDLGTDVEPNKFIQAINNDAGVDIIALSALLTTTMPMMKTIIDAVQAAGLRDRVKIIIGGAPVTEEYARSIGADGYAQDASRAAALVKSLIT